MDLKETLLQNNILDRVELALSYPLELVERYCNENKELNQTICLNEDFWKETYLKNNLIPQIKPISWKELYYESLGGHVYAFGSNLKGQLGLGSVTDVSTPTKIPGLRGKFKQISAGFIHNLLIDNNDEVHVFGFNFWGQLGVGDKGKRVKATKIGMKAKQISAGSTHSLIIDLNNDVYSFGSNQFGQLGLGQQIKSKSVPTKIPDIKAKYIYAGGDNSVIIDQDNNLYTFGNNSYGQLGLGDKTSRFLPTKVNTPVNLKAKQASLGDHFGFIVDLSDKLYFTGQHFKVINSKIIESILVLPTNTNFTKRVKQVSIKGTSASLIDHEGNVYGFGTNQYNQLGYPIVSYLPRVHFIHRKAEKVSVGVKHSLLIDLEGDVYATGNNTYGELGIGNYKDKDVYTKIPNIKAKEVSAGGNYSLLITCDLIISFDTLKVMLENQEIKDYEIEESKQIPYKLKMGIYLFTFNTKSGNKYYVFGKYNSENNTILPF